MFLERSLNDPPPSHFKQPSLLLPLPLPIHHPSPPFGVLEENSTADCYHPTCLCSTPGDVQYTGRISLSTPGGVLYSGGYHDEYGGYHKYSGDVQYTGGYQDECGDIMTAAGGVQWTGGYHDECAGIS